MAWYAYCVTEKQAFPELVRQRKPVPLETIPGIEGNQVFLYLASDLAVVVSEHIPPEQTSPQHAKDHARVIADCFKVTTVLPFRLDTVFANDEQLRRSMRTNQKRFLANLSQLRDKTEMHIKLTLEDCISEPVREGLGSGGAGRTYLSDMREEALRQRERKTRARALSMQLNRMFSPLSEEISCRRLDSGRMQLDVSHLIATRSVERYQNKYQTAHEQIRNCRLQLCGPWPPYHFVQSTARSAATPSQQPRAVSA